MNCFSFPRIFYSGTRKSPRKRWWLVVAVWICFPVLAWGQEQKVTVDLRDAKVQEVLMEIKRQTGLNFVYSPEQLAVLPARDVEAKNETVDALMERLLEGSGLEHAFEMGSIVIRRKAEQPQQAVEERCIRGVVKDEAGEPLPGVTILLKGTTVGTATDIDGAYELNIPNMKDITLVFSFIGMETKEVKPGSRNELDVVMAAAQENLEEVVVTGIFRRNKEGFSGSTTVVTSEDIKRMTSSNVLKALEIADPSFKINMSNLAGSNPNAIPDFQMRGQSSIGNYQSDDVVVLRGDVDSRPNQPLFVLDGVIGVDATTIMDLDPDQVASITLLKDASATVIYGSEAANGVVVVETKAPEPGKLRFSYSGNYQLSWPDLTVYNLMNAEEKLRIEELAGYYTNKNNIELQQYYNRLKQEVMSGVNTYWLAVPVQTAFIHRHGLTIEGGTPELRYKVYLGARWAPGVMKDSDLATKSGSITLNYRTNKLMINNQLTVDYSNGARTSPYGDFQEYAQLNPYYRKHDENGTLLQVLDDHRVGNTYIAGYSTPTLNPLWNTQFESKDESRDFELREALKVEWLPIENLRLSLDFSLSRSDGTVETFKSSEHNDFYNETDPAEKGSYYWYKSENSDYRVSLSGSYNNTFKEDHLLAAYARYQLKESVSKGTSITMKGFPNDKLSEVYMGTEYQSTGGSESTARALSFIMTLNYMYKQKYAFDFSLSVDGSSEFGANNRFAPFWSVGLRWNAEKESFVKNWGIFDELIFRATYGVTGSQGFTPYQSLQMYTYTSLMETYKSSDVVGTEIYSLGNPNLKWQQTQNYNASIDFTMFKQLLAAKFEYYEEYTKNTLLDYTLAPSIGFGSMKENLGKISNKGYEVTLRLMPYSDASKEAYWNIVLSGSHNKSRIEEISNALKEMNEQQMAQAESDEDRERVPLPRYEEGYSQTAIWVVRSLGIDPATGREVYLTRDGQRTYEYNSVDQIPYGDTEPKFSGSVSTTFTYKGFSATLAGQYRWGGQDYNSTLVSKVENANLRLNADRRALYDRWQEPGDETYFKAISRTINTNSTKESSRFVMDDNEFYFSTINLSYRMNSEKFSFLKRAGISSMNVGLYMEDICRFSTIKMERGVDYPFARNISMSLSVIF